MPPRIAQVVFMVLGAVFGVIALVPSNAPAPSSSGAYVAGAVVAHLIMAAISLFCLLRGWRAVQAAKRIPTPSNQPPQP